MNIALIAVLLVTIVKLVRGEANAFRLSSRIIESRPTTRFSQLARCQPPYTSSYCKPKLPRVYGIAERFDEARITWIWEQDGMHIGTVLVLEIQLIELLASGARRQVWRRTHTNRPETLTSFETTGLRPGRTYVALLSASNANALVVVETENFTAREYVSVECRPSKDRLVDLKVGQKVSVACNVHGGPELQVKFEHTLPDPFKPNVVHVQESDDNQTLRIIFPSITVEQEKVHCVRARTTHLEWMSECFEISLRTERPTTRYPRVRPPKPRVSAVANLTSITVRWSVSNDSSTEPFRVTVRISDSIGYFFSPAVINSSARQYTFFDLQPGSRYQVTVRTHRHDASRKAIKLVTTKEHAFIKCPAHPTFNKASGYQVTLRMTCQYGGNPKPQLILPAGFTQENDSHPSHLTLTAPYRSRMLGVKHCIKLRQSLPGQDDWWSQSCFSVNPRRRRGRTVVRVRPRSPSNHANISTIRCMVKGSPLPRSVQWRLDGQFLDLNTRPLPIWLHRTSTCLSKLDKRSEPVMWCTLKVIRTALRSIRSEGRIGCSVETNNSEVYDEALIQLQL